MPATPATPAAPGHIARRTWRCAAVLCALFVVLLVLVACSWGPLISLDRRVADGLHPLAVGHQGWTRVVRWLSGVLWDPWTMRAVLAIAAIRLARRREWLLVVWIAVTSALGTVLQQTLKAAVGRSRPRWPDPVATASYQAFPSGHALTATVTCGLLVWLLWLHRSRAGVIRVTWAASAVSVIGVGFTRLYLGVHWLSDVVAGWLLGGALVSASAWAYEVLVRGRADERGLCITRITRLTRRTR
ncbi:phosphatase PAP2 family protein [Streptomyces sp. UNOC14_S4]|uniref:phosphatase PAP2 family protein n=1 Tax=Streptomyces sp. UNOC14_S4 TaxID=2872340 RepID=UPI001E34120C|nr:phosphatase PAP2 family protein [Streptomyces sp. UNOC14_S4]MCC3766142.1 phosphatase PAP2 family protein [Streptomyces sp. UNOC14_S4]